MYNTDIRHTHLVFRHLLLLDSLPSMADNDWEEEGCVISHRQGVSISPLLKWMVAAFSYPVLNESCLTSMNMKIRRVCTSICRSYQVCINDSMRCLFSRFFVIVSIMGMFIRPRHPPGVPTLHYSTSQFLPPYYHRFLKLQDSSPLPPRAS
jgi:hypothetical protein